MPFSDFPPQFVFPDTRLGRELRADFISEEPESLRSCVVTCPDFGYMRYPVYTDDDVHNSFEHPLCARRKRDGVRDKNWCLRCVAGFPHVWLTEHDAEGLSDRHHIGF